jgi:uncharacterized membrane protein (UPF0127 family)
MRRIASITALSILLASVLGGACSSSSGPTGGQTAVPTVVFATTKIEIGGARTIDAEVATTEPQSERGLGYRDTLAPDAGMIFDLHEERVPSFWMKGMRFALDMVWIGADKRVVGVTPDIRPEPRVADAQLRRYAPAEPVRYVLEVGSGGAARLGLVAGTQLAFSIP